MRFKNIRIIILLNVFLLILSCGHQKNVTNSNKKETTVYPFSDPENSGNWVLNADVSDEFEDDKIDEDKWYIVGKFKDGKPFYKHPDKPNKKVWKGRAPSQFSGRNYRLENGKLILETRWEPDFPFSDDVQKPWGKKEGQVEKFENLTTACFVGRKFFKYGYMEIKSKAADAEITSAFWAIGNGVELDVFEQFGDHRQPNKEANGKDRELWWSIHDWARKNKVVYTEHLDYGFRVADNFHVYGIEWNEKGLKLYVDGKYKTGATKEQVEAYALKKHNLPDGWIMTKPLSIWLDQETFPWHGVPDSKKDLELNSPEGKKDDGVVDFEIEYVRVWQKK
ncbi:Glycosyl hydrolases family 16 [Polaribacter sp. KT25b]|uniref:family 16 glycosylhydrolase n=1 Tax=Polaribacter sp. KT25b TaxID=1855336 RepID=UPI00087A7D62|nr:family 16 glycosylhydrolase [Polaribacter sp. KT25b]SDR69671.1 Glycosyl hydrolases family 16 [Polaribacter sp. KT25b]